MKFYVCLKLGSNPIAPRIHTLHSLTTPCTVEIVQLPNRQHGGGLVIYTLSDISTVRRPELEHPDIECLAIQVTLSSNTKHFIFACYRPPSESTDVFFNTLSSLLDAASKESSYLTLLGDFNAKHSTWDSQTNSAGTRLFQL